MLNKLKIAGMAAKTAGRILFKPGIKKGVISGVKARNIKAGMKALAMKPQAAINPNAKRLTKPQMLKGLRGDMRKRGQKRLEQIDVLAEKRKASQTRLSEGLANKRAYDAKHGKGSFTKHERELLTTKQIRRKDTIKKLEQTSKGHRKAHKEAQVRDLTKPRSEYQDLKIQQYCARHHKSGVNTSFPIFDNLPLADAQKLRKYGKKFDAEFGDVLNNLIDVPGDVKHTLGNIHNAKLHAWMKKVGIDTPPKVSPDAPWEVRMKVMQDYIVDLRRQAIKLKELMGGPKGSTPVEKLTLIKPSLTLKDLGIKK